MTTAQTAFEAGVYDDKPEDAYHADDALSSSGARKLLPPSCPARYRYDRDHPEATKRHFEYGSAAHRLVLGRGAEWVLLDYPDYRTKAAQQAQKEARAIGAVPILAGEYEQIQAMAAAIKTHPLAGPLLAGGMAERSYFWTDEGYGIRRRARLDTSRHGASGRLLVVDYKTTVCAEPGAFAKACANYGYHQQAAWYLDAVIACEGETDPAFLFVAQEKVPPYLVTVAQLDDDAIAAGDALNYRAMEIFRDCTASGVWPGYQDDNDIPYISLPRWAREDYL
jgi:hypothetical protein